MGKKERGKDEKPIHSVKISDFSIGKTEVTQAQWKAIMRSNPSNFKGDNLPVEQVSWDDVQVFLDKLNEKTGKIYRLPTEAEWEYAVSGCVGQKWAGTNNESNLSNYAWYDVNSNGKTHPVGTKQPNQFGLFDMSGNVWEWCNDWFSKDYYKESPKDNPKGPLNGYGRVIRGGCWDNNAKDFLSANRWGNIPGKCGSHLGFRLALVP